MNRQVEGLMFEHVLIVRGRGRIQRVGIKKR